MNDEQLLEMIQKAIVTSCCSLRQQGTIITGYALCTDDNLRTLYHIASSLPHGGNRPRWANPVDWTVTARDAKPLFLQASDSLSTNATQASKIGRLGDHVRRSFELLVVALERASPAFQSLTSGSNILRLVVSTDPSPELSKMEREAARRLNPPELFEKWLVAMHPAAVPQRPANR